MRFSAKRILVVVAVLGIALLPGTRAMAVGLGLANDFNLFMLGDVERTHGDVDGRAAVGGDARLTNFWVSKYHPFDPLGNLVVGGDLTLTSASVGSDQKGKAIVGGSSSISSSQTPTLIHGHPIDFAAEGAYLAQYARFWAGLPAGGTSTIVPGIVTLTGSDPFLNIFSLPGSIGNLRLDFQVPEGSTVLVNLSGDHGQMYSLGYGYELGFGVTIDPHLVLYNFYEATTLDLKNIGVKGSVLAPLAQVNFESGHVDGTLIGRSLTSWHAEEHIFPFRGDLPAAVPEAGSLLLLGSGLILLRAFRSRFKGPSSAPLR